MTEGKAVVMGEGVEAGGLVRLKEVARRLGRSVNTVHRLKNAGQIEYVRVNGQVLFRPEVVDAFIEARTTRAEV